MYKIAIKSQELLLILLTIIVTIIIYTCFKATLMDPTDNIVK